ncbi:MAG TPA: sulfotransferase domain-containing protein [Actinomycetota bacterium]|jgi:hypothetical protein|nr:sulfotransferase domain-containing protein [Actinomycetota bacterium]
MANAARAKNKLRQARFRHRTLRRPLVLLRHRGLAPQDAFLASYPRSGTTWLRFLLYETLTGDDSGFGLMRGAIPSVGKQAGARPVLRDGGKLVQTHEPYCDRDRKTIYIARDPRSVVCSEFSWQQRSGYYGGGFDRFVTDFAAGRTNPWGSWADHVEHWRRDSAAARGGHLLSLRYEDLRADTLGVFKGVLEFLEADVDHDRVVRAIENNSLDGMRAKEDRAQQEGWRRSARPDIRFVNSGAVGGWRERLDRGQVRLVEERFGRVMRSLGYEPAEAV